MNGELSNRLPGLTTSGNRIVIADTVEPILLRGVNRSGLEYAGPDEQGFLSGAAISRLEIEVIVRRWRCNIIRLPFNQDFVLRGRGGRSGEEYLRALDQVIYWASLFGAYTLLDLQWLDADRTTAARATMLLPFRTAIRSSCGLHLQIDTKTNLRFSDDLFNEPHDRLDDDPFALNKEDGTIHPAHQRKVTMREWQPWARVLANAVRAECPDALVFIAGTNWAYDLRGMPMDLANVVYSTHVYSNKGNDWAAAFGDLSRSLPVFVGEFGVTNTRSDLKFGRRLTRYLRDLEIGSAAWSWFNEPFLVDRYAATPFGELVRRQRAGRIRRLRLIKDCGGCGGVRDAGCRFDQHLSFICSGALRKTCE